METQVIQPLNRLVVMFQGPHKVIKKRHDKLLDYDNSSIRLKGFKESDREYKSVRKSYNTPPINYHMHCTFLAECPDRIIGIYFDSNFLWIVHFMTLFLGQR